MQFQDHADDNVASVRAVLPENRGKDIKIHWLWAENCRKRRYIV